jgi:hypothetical protein
MKEAPRLRLSPAVWITALLTAVVAFGAAHMSVDYVLPLVYGGGFLCVAALVEASVRTGQWAHWVTFSQPPLSQSEWAVALAGAAALFVSGLVGWYRWT